MRIIIFEGAIEPLDFQLEEIRRVLISKYDADVLVINSKNLLQGLGSLENFTKKKVDCLFTMNNLGINLSLSGNHNLWELFQIPIINLIVDHPSHYDNALLNAPQNMVLGVVDRNHIDFVKRFYPNIKHVFFFPLGGVPEEGAAGNGHFCATTEEHFSGAAGECSDNLKAGEHAGDSAAGECAGDSDDIDIFYGGGISKPFLGNIIPDNLEEYQKFFDIQKFQQDIFDRLTGEPEVTFEKAVEEYLVAACVIENKGFWADAGFSNGGESITAGAEIGGGETKKSSEVLDNNVSDDIKNDTSFLRTTIHDFRFIEGLACSYFREGILHEIISSGLKVTVCGNGWNALPISQNENFDYRGLVPMKEVLSMMSRSKIVLNTLTWFKAGFHDRIPNAMLRHAALITDESSYINERFPDNGKEMIHFSLREIQKLPSTIRELLDDDEKRIAMAENGFEKALKEDTWEKRVEEYLVPEIDKPG